MQMQGRVQPALLYIRPTVRAQKKGHSRSEAHTGGDAAIGR